tara:strand:- start:386 stop:844 length:459 start_codon:yes stop_codon:yes gene_type:complete
MKNEQQPSAWPSIEARLVDEAKRDVPDFPPFLHRRIMAAVYAEAEKQSRSTPGLAKAWRWVFAGALAAIALALALRPAPAPQPMVAGTPQKVSEWIVMAANSDQQMASLISDRVLNDMVNAPYQRQLDSLGSELESALDFTLRLMPIEVALK